MTEETPTLPTEAQTTPIEVPKVEPKINYEDFAKVELKVGIIKEAEKLVKSNKLMKLQVDLGEESGPRQVIAGIAKRYSSEELIGRRIVVVANLNPAKLMGEESNGMLLAASDTEGNLELLSIPDNLPAGSSVK